MEDEAKNMNVKIEYNDLDVADSIASLEEPKKQIVVVRKNNPVEGKPPKKPTNNDKEKITIGDVQYNPNEITWVTKSLIIVNKRNSEPEVKHEKPETKKEGDYKEEYYCDGVKYQDNKLLVDERDEQEINLKIVEKPKLKEKKEPKNEPKNEPKEEKKLEKSIIKKEESKIEPKEEKKHEKSIIKKEEAAPASHPTSKIEKPKKEEPKPQVAPKTIQQPVAPPSIPLADPKKPAAPKSKKKKGCCAIL